MTLAENVAISDHKLYIHGGAIKVVPVPQLPWFTEFALAGRLEAEGDELGTDHTFSVVIFQPDGEMLFPLQPIEFTLGEEHRIAENWDPLQVLVSLKLNPIALRETGWYTVDVGLDGQTVEELQVLVRLRAP